MAGASEEQPSFIEGLKEKYEELMASLEEKGVPSPRVLLPALILVIILAAGYFLLPSSIIPSKKDLSLVVENEGGTPLAKMNVKLSSDLGFSASGTTDADGFIKFMGVPEKGELSIEVSDPNKVYKTFKDAISPTTKTITMLELENAGDPVAFAVWVTDSSSTYLMGASVEIVLDDGTKESRSTDYRGTAEFEFQAPPNHLTVKVSAKDYKGKELSVSKGDIEAGAFQVSLESSDESKNSGKDDSGREDPVYGSVQVLLSSATEEGLEGIRVALVDAATLRSGLSGRTDASGTVLFEDVLLGKEYFAEVDESALYLGDSSEDFTLTSSSEMLQISFDLLEKRLGDYIDLEITSEEGPVSGANVYIFDSLGKQLKSDYSDDDGKLSLLVNREKEYFITVYSLGYLPVAFLATASPAPMKVPLQKESEENSAELKVTVLQDGETIEGAEVALYREDGRFLGIPFDFTDLNGEVIFTIPRAIEGAAYKLFAKAARDSDAGTSGLVRAGEPQTIQITLSGAPATLGLELLDAVKKKVLEQGTISAIDASGAVLSSCEIKEKKCELVVPSNYELTLAAISPGYLQTTSDPLILMPQELRALPLYLVSQADAGSVLASFIGVYDSQGEALEVGNAQSYIAKFLVTFPSASEVSGFHLHVSSPGDFIQIKEIDSAYQSLFSSSRFSPENCYSGTDNGTIGSFDLLFPKGATGSREIAVRFFVDADAPASSSFAFNFKAYSLKKGIIFSYPAEEELQKAPESSPPLDVVKKMCAAKNANKVVQVTSSPLICTDNGAFCRKITFDRIGDIPLGSEFSVNFEILSQEQIESIGIGSKNVKLVGSSIGTGFADEIGASGELVAVTIPSEIKTPGTLRFSAARAGTTDLQLNFISDKRTFKYHKNLRITGENLMKVSVSPLALQTGEEKKLIIRALSADDRPITDATVTLYDCDRAPLAAEELQLSGNDQKDEGADGRYALTAAPVVNGKIGVRITHPDYKTYDECLIDVGINEDSLAVSPTSLRLEGDSRFEIEKEIVVSTSLDVKSTLSIIHNCGTSATPVIYAEPNLVQNFKDSATIVIGILPNVTVKKTCNLIVEQKFTKKTSISRTVPIRIDVHGPGTPPVTDASPSPSASETPDASASPTPSGELNIADPIEIQLDSNNFRAKRIDMRDYGLEYSCDIISFSPDFRVRRDCTNSFILLTADYSALSITRSFRQAGKLKITTADDVFFFDIVVTAPQAPPDVDGGGGGASPSPGSDGLDENLNYYSSLPPVPDPIVIELDPYTRRHTFDYSLGAFGEAVTSCDTENLDYGITTEFCGPIDQKVRLVADFSSFDVYNRLLVKIYGNNPACMNYYEHQGYGQSIPPYGSNYLYDQGYGGNLYGGYGSSPYGGYGSNVGNPNYGISGNLYGGYGSTGGDYLGGNIYGNAGYGLPNYDYPSNQFGNGYYPAPQYQGGYIDYSNYPNMNYMQQPYLYPAPPYTDSNLRSSYGLSYGIGASPYDPAYSATNCNAGMLEGSLVFIMKSGVRQSVVVQIIAKGGTLPYQNQYGPRSVPYYGYGMGGMQQGQQGYPQGQRQTAQNEVLSTLKVELDPFIMQRYAEFKVPRAASGAGSISCKAETDPDYFDNIGSNLNYNPLYNTDSTSSRQQPEPSSSGKYSDVIKPLSCDKSGSDLAIKFTADAAEISVPKKNPINSESELYLRMSYLSPVKTVLAPIVLSLPRSVEESLKEYGFETITPHLQFILTNAEPQLTGEFKYPTDIFKEADCTVSGIKDGNGETQFLGDSDGGTISKLALQASFEKAEFKANAEGTKLVVAAVGEGTVKELPKPVSGSIKCATLKGSVSAKLHVAAIPKETLITKEDGVPKFADISVPFAGEIVRQDSGKQYNCTISSSNLKDGFAKAMEGKPETERKPILSCILSENSLRFTADYTALAELEKKYAGLEDTLTLNLYSNTLYLKAKITPKYTQRLLASVSVKFKLPGEREPGTPGSGGETPSEDDACAPVESNTYSLGVDTSSVCFLADREPDRKHQGIDIGDADGDPTKKSEVPIRAAFKGTVVFSGKRTDCLGNTVVIESERDGKKIYTLYGHMSKIIVKEKTVVEKCTQIGNMGSSGKETCSYEIGHHLHFQSCTENPLISDDDANICFIPGLIGIKPKPPVSLNLPGDCNVCDNENTDGGSDKRPQCNLGGGSTGGGSQVPASIAQISSSCNTLLKDKSNYIVIEVAKSPDGGHDISNICISGQNALLQPTPLLGEKFKVDLVWASSSKGDDRITQIPFEIAFYPFGTSTPLEPQFKKELKESEITDSSEYEINMPAEKSEKGYKLVVKFGNARMYYGGPEFMNDPLKAIVLPGTNTAGASAGGWGIASCDVSPYNPTFWFDGVKFSLTFPKVSDDVNLYTTSERYLYVETYCEGARNSKFSIGPNDLRDIDSSGKMENIETMGWADEELQICDPISVLLTDIGGKPWQGSQKIVCKKP